MDWRPAAAERKRWDCGSLLQLVANVAVNFWHCNIRELAPEGE
jgi:hypothetical protein